MASEKNKARWWQVLGPDFPYAQLVTGGLIPIFIFYIFSTLDQALLGALLAAGWGALALLVTYWRERELNVFALIAIPGMLIELIGTIVTGSAEFYLAAAAITNGLWGIVFLGSLLLPRSMIQLIAEALSPNLGSEQFLKEIELTQRQYKRTWQYLTAMWGIANLFTAMILFVAQLRLSLEAYLVVRTVTGFPVTIALILVSARFPARHWKRIRHFASE
ncbi:MAG: VC0807 family protein [Candidatus Promineifilaceae bacterium]|nr:VC0807 family protein [Candidatus Promineifilaceae bacterium]